MAFTFADLLETLGGNHQHGGVSESSVGEIATAIEYNNMAQLKALFPLETFSDTTSVAYVPSIFCNSYPKRNKRGRMFLPRVLANSAASARDNLVNIEHGISDNGGTREDIIGHIKASSFPWNESADLPSTPLPMYALNTLYLRHPRVKDILSERERTKKWFTSMECGHDLKQACLSYRGEFIPVKDAESGMMECVKKFSISPYKGHELSLCLGGEQGSVDFWGYALTQAPADTEASILGIVSSGREVASVEGQPKKKYFAISYQKYFVPEKTAEAASEVVDKRITELASIGVIGSTEPAEDGHAHEVLSNGTILPYNGHTHYLQSWILTRGTNPRFTGQASTHSVYSEATRVSIEHAHLLNINLRGKAKVGSSSESEPDSEVSHFIEDSVMEVKNLLAKVEAMVTKLSSGNPTLKTGEQASVVNAELISELNVIRSELANSNSEAEIAARIKKEVASQIEAGVILPKESFDAKVKEIEEKAKADADALAKKAEIRQKRLDKIVTLGINLLSNPYEDKPEDTVQSRIDAIEYDPVGDRIYDLEYKNLVLLKEKAELAASANKALAEAASKPVVPAKKIPLLVGAASEAANAGIAAPVTDANGKRLGRHAFS